MWKRRLRAALAGIALTGAIGSTCLGEILITTVGADTGKVLDTKLVPDGKTEIRTVTILVPGK